MGDSCQKTNGFVSSLGGPSLVLAHPFPALALTQPRNPGLAFGGVEKTEGQGRRELLPASESGHLSCGLCLCIPRGAAAVLGLGPSLHPDPLVMQGRAALCLVWCPHSP